MNLLESFLVHELNVVRAEHRVELAKLKRKLATLRLAAKRAKSELEHSHSHGSHKAIPMLATAIEASR